MLEDAKKAVSEMEYAVADLETEVNKLTEQLSRAESKKPKLPPFEQTNEYKSIVEQINKIKSDNAHTAPDTSDIDNLIQKYRNEEAVLNSAKASLETAAVQRSRITELEKMERELGKSYEAEQRSLYLCEKFTRIKASLLTDKINERFKSVSFKLFRENLTNDGVDDVCEVLTTSPDGARVQFGNSNNAAKINAGLEIISVLGEHYGVKLPIFVDNAESVTNLNNINGQLIRLIVSEADKNLRIELI
jgi:uncharacterized coiled-coil protein SlyX